jgi:BMFP domain-containing protein YqiC
LEEEVESLRGALATAREQAAGLASRVEALEKDKESLETDRKVNHAGASGSDAVCLRWTIYWHRGHAPESAKAMHGSVVAWQLLKAHVRKMQKQIPSGDAPLTDLPARVEALEKELEDSRKGVCAVQLGRVDDVT